MPDSTEERLNLLEAHQEVQESLIFAMQTERIEAERLNDSVARLGENADALTAALHQVDQTQQMMTKLGRQISRVEDAAITKKEAALLAEEKAQEARAERKKVIRKGIIVLAAIGLTLFSLVFYVSNSAHGSCQSRQDSTTASRDVLASFLDGDNGDERIQRGIDRLDQTLVKSCGEQYRLHL